MMTVDAPLQKSRTSIAPAALLVVVAALYLVRLHDAPIYLSPDEATIAVDAHSLASTGRDVHGAFLPLYFKVQVPGEPRMGWFTPVIFYVSALFQNILPFAEWSVRLPTACVGLLDVVLMWLIARRVFGNERLALVAAALLAFTPAHFILSRYALDYLYPLPFVLAWVLCLLMFFDEGRPALLFAATIALGIGFYSYIGSVVMMPLYFGITCVLLYLQRTPRRNYAIAAAGFAVPLVFVAAWLVAHPTAFSDTVQRYDLYNANELSPLQGLREFLSFPNIDRLANLYWSFFSPSFLFLSGDRAVMFSTRTVGVFLLAFAALLPLGIARISTTPYSPAKLLAVAGFVTGPAAAVLGAEDSAIIRAVEMLPFGALLATFGVEYLWTAPLRLRIRQALLPLAGALLALGSVYAVWRIATQSRVGGGPAALLALGIIGSGTALVADRTTAGRAAALCLAALMVVQSGYFLFDYFTDYRVRSSYWLGGNLRGALDELIDRAQDQRAPGVYLAKFRSTSGLLDTRNRWIDVYWKFYLIKHHREDLLARSEFVDLQDWTKVREMPSGSLVLGNLEDPTTAQRVTEGHLSVVHTIPEIAGAPFFSILRRQPGH